MSRPFKIPFDIASKKRKDDEIPLIEKIGKVASQINVDKDKYEEAVKNYFTFFAKEIKNYLGKHYFLITVYYSYLIPGLRITSPGSTEEVGEYQKKLKDWYDKKFNDGKAFSLVPISLEAHKLNQLPQKYCLILSNPKKRHPLDGIKKIDISSCYKDRVLWKGWEKIIQEGNDSDFEKVISNISKNSNKLGIKKCLKKIIQVTCEKNIKEEDIPPFILAWYPTHKKWPYLYYIPSPMLSNTPVGGIVVGAVKPIDKKILLYLEDIALKGTVNINFLEHKEKVKQETIRHGTKAAVTTIMSRNLSHNIGSHVLSYWNQELEKNLENATSEELKDKSVTIEKLKDNIKKSKDLFQYIQHRMDFLAEVSTSIPCSEMSLDIENDILNPFRKFSLPSTWLDWSNPDGSVLLRYLAHSEHIDLHKKIEVEIDTNLKNKRISVPNGLIGIHAIYSILENFIRNAAKHYEDKKKNHESFIRIVVKNPTVTEWQDKYIAMSVFDMREDSCNKEKVEKLRGYMPGGKEYEFTDEGRIAPKGWGFKEMLTSANFLRKNQPSILVSPELLKAGNLKKEPPLFEILCGNDVEGQPCCSKRVNNCCHSDKHYKKKLGIRVYLRKPKDLAVTVDSVIIKKKEIFEIEKINLLNNESLGEEIPHRILLVDNEKVKKQYEKDTKVPCRIIVCNDITEIDDKCYLKLYKRFIKIEIQGTKRKLPQLSYQGQITMGGGGFFINKHGSLSNVPRALKEYFLTENNGKEWGWTNKQKNTIYKKLLNPIIFYYHANIKSEHENIKELVNKGIYVQPISGGYSTKTKLESLKNLSDDKLKEHFALELVESALTKVVIIDERVSEWAKDKFNDIDKRKFLKNMNVFIINVNLKKVTVDDIKKKLNMIKNVHFFVIHQGILDKFEKNKKKSSKKFMREFVPNKCLWRIVDSGRGVPSNLFKDVRFIEISVLLKMLSEYDKHALVQALFSLRRPEIERNGEYEI